MKEKKAKREGVKFFLFISPWLVGFLLFTLIPMGMSFYYSFTDWDVLTPANVIGITNYVELFQDPLFYQSLKVTGVYTLITVPLNVFLSLLIAMLLNLNGRFVGMLRTLYYLPAVLSSVVVAVLWQWIFNSKYGLLNAVLKIFGGREIRWLSDPKWVMWALVIMSIWGIGGGIIMYLAGLQAVPKDLYEAATLDGAGFWKKLFAITIPSMSPIMLFTFLTCLIGTLQTFSQAYVMTSGGPNHSTLFYAFYLYQNGIVYKKMGKACAMAWFFFLVVGLISFFILKASGRLVYYETEEGGKLV